MGSSRVIMTTALKVIKLGLVLSLAVSLCQGMSWGQVTANSTGAPCWFDMKPGGRECAICTSEGQQCGYPMHNRCRWNVKGLNKHGWIKGCPGVPKRKTTLSALGYPCPWDPSDRSCPWCSAGNVLCFVNGRIRCYDGEHMKYYLGDTYDDYCKSQDCMEFPEACHPNASCKTFQFQRMKISKDNWGFTDATINRCVCDSGFIGNGVTCANATTGVVYDNTGAQVEQLRLTVNMAKEATVEEGLWDEKPLGESTQQVYSDVQNMKIDGHSNSTSAICTPVEAQNRDEL